MRLLRQFGIFLLLVMAALYAISQEQSAASDTSAVGHWRLNVDKSDYGSMPKPKAGTLNVTSDSAGSLKWSAKLTNADGKKETYNFSGPEDGKPHPVTGDNPWKTAAYTRADNKAASADITLKDGSNLKQEFTITVDSMTVKNTTSQGSGTEVWERVKGGPSKP